MTTILKQSAARQWIEAVLVSALWILGIAYNVDSNKPIGDTWFTIIQVLGIVISILYLFYFNRYYQNEKSILPNILTRWVLALYPIGFIVSCINIKIGEIIALVYLVTAILTLILRRKNIDKSLIFWFWLFLGICTMPIYM